ncbi:MAG: hypothetical protein HY369_04255 [Candidatus Aenigmarchaeota archaeon]|nr:hypothetical protein [Candidatus Aenigmarchaeota archaeon]
MANKEITKMRKNTTVIKPRYCADCRLGLAPAQTTETCPRCRPEANARLMAELLQEREDRNAARLDNHPEAIAAAERSREATRQRCAPRPQAWELNE